MPQITQTMSQDYLDAYKGAAVQKVGAGLLNPNIYATPEYAKKKIKNLALGLISEVVYSGFDHDSSPMILPYMYEARYSTVLAFNLNYVPPRIRKGIMRYVIESNASRIKSNQPIIINYDSIKRAIPQVRGIIRRYKVSLLNPKDTYHLVEWPELVNKKSKWEGMYKESM